MTAAAVVCAIALSAAGCGTTGAGKTMTIDEARSEAVTELRSVLELAPDTWPQEVPKPVANDCKVDGQTAVQFSYFVEVAEPGDPESLVEEAGDHWKQRGYELSTTTSEMDAATGKVYAIVARAKDKPRASIAATKVRAHVNVDSVCVLGDPDDYR
ncbi:hypothetical protein [Curtobacterium flaccumfaciens]|uniref:hypothetical protein n=1 Tax=Curtobacterium flaccumfaciens TaxID=2035 RepID=UPI001BE02C72|nr:hypothetical protein [Curtobacterium flaccumfaciens]MBT1585749.1 hypothetical protein [Curtobacterium flaccumfaciens pv. flaccumfaciens]MCX2797450.1 hypothetical protein [Curtobacterium flaccumfaciens pv. flaccumfaciens]